MQLYSQLWGGVRPFGKEFMLLQSELQALLTIMPKRELALYYRHVGRVVEALDRRPNRRKPQKNP